MRRHWLAFLLLWLCLLQIATLYDRIIISAMYSLFSKKGYLKLQVAFCLANQYNH